MLAATQRAQRCTQFVPMKLYHDALNNNELLIVVLPLLVAPSWHLQDRLMMNTVLSSINVSSPFCRRRSSWLTA